MAKTRCPARYKNLGLETFGDRKKVTDDVLTQFCKNDEWLRRQVEELRYLTPPAVRKSLKIGETFDEENSWGCMANYKGQVQFSTLTQDSIEIDLKSEEGLSRWYDYVNSTTEVVPMQKTENGEVQEYKIVSLKSEITKDTGKSINIGTAELYKGYNSAWYVGYDKSKPFYLKPKWIKNWKSIDGSTKVKDRIPAIARAQTFKVPSGKGGYLSAVDIQLEYNGVPTMSSSPLHVQIWDTYQGWVNKTKWDNKHKKVVKVYETIAQHVEAMGSQPPSSWTRYSKKKVYKKDKKGNYVKDKKGNKIVDDTVFKKDNNGNYIVKRRKVAKPNSKKGKAIKKPLAEYVYNPTDTIKGGMQTMAFDNLPKLKENTSYAIVLLSPLNNWENCPRWCGWGRNCKKDEETGKVGGTKDETFYDGKVYTGGDAFYSSDNGISWKRYGKNGTDDEITVYRQGKYTPQDFKFRCRLQTKNDTFVTYPTDTKELRLKPIYSNPIYSVKISSIDFGSETTERNNGSYVYYQLSTDGDNWIDFDENNKVNLDTPSRVVFIRALLKTDNANTTQPPYVEKITVDLNMNLPDEMYVRTKQYTPEKFGTILGASVWGRIFAPYTLENENLVDCTVEVIQTKVDKEHFDIVDLEMLDEKLDEVGVDTSWLDNLSSTDSRCSYLTSHPEIIESLKEYNIYILPYEMEDGIHNLSFAPLDSDGERIYVEEPLSDDASDIVIDETTNEETTELIPKYSDNIGGISLDKEVAYPVVSCQLEPEDSDGEGVGQLSSFGEWYDYTFDYTSNELIFKRDTLNRMPVGTLIVSYNPVFISGLTNEEIGIHYDEDGNRTDGLIMDYFKESIAITNEIATSNTVKLKVDAVDPIRQVNLYTNTTDEPISLIEDDDYYYNLHTHELEFPVVSANTNSSILEEGNVLEVVYTPNLDDTSICIGYHAKRQNTSVQCYIDDYYIEYKV